jgi:6-phosphogluconolactonase (cycloisomerase 2 family)
MAGLNDRPISPKPKEPCMKSLTRLGCAAAMAAALTAAAAGPASAATTHQPTAAKPVVFVQTDNVAGNQVVTYDRAANGTLKWAHTDDTSGLGGVLSGSVVDHLASQGSLTYDQDHALLFAVNAGSNTLSVFSVRGDHLTLQQVVSSGGTFPVSVAVHGNLVAVANAEVGGSIQEYVVLFDHVFPIPGSNRALGLDPTATPQFTNTPGQVAYSPDGSKLIVTTKANGNNIDVFGVGPFGALSAHAVVNSEPGTVPFGITFDHAGHLVVAETGPNALATFKLNGNGTVTAIDAVPTGQAATCWVAPVKDGFVTSNAGSATVSEYRSGPGGALALEGATPTDPGTVDASATPHGHFLYVQTGAKGIVDEFHVKANGALQPIGAVTVANAIGGEGIVAL